VCIIEPSKLIGVETMDQKDGLINFSKNITPIMGKCKNGQKLTKEEQNTIVEFYLEVLNYIMKV